MHVPITPMISPAALRYGPTVFDRCLPTYSFSHATVSPASARLWIAIGSLELGSSWCACTSVLPRKRSRG
jgi:hypothetical protein